MSCRDSSGVNVASVDVNVVAGADVPNGTPASGPGWMGMGRRCGAHRVVAQLSRRGPAIVPCHGVSKMLRPWS
jgi:hypothetical protein